MMKYFAIATLLSMTTVVEAFLSKAATLRSSSFMLPTKINQKNDHGSVLVNPIHYIKNNGEANVDDFQTTTKETKATTTRKVLEEYAAATTASTNASTNKKQKGWNQPVHKNVCPQTGVTLSRYMREMSRCNPELEEIETIFISLQVACKAIGKLVRTAAFDDNLTGLHNGGGSINVQGEEQKKMDVLANDILKNALKWTGKLGTLASEEEDTPVAVITDTTSNGSSGEAIVDSAGSYIAVFDPVDGSSNVDVNIPVGTIFGIFKHSEECDTSDWDMLEHEICQEDVLQPGKNLVAAGYCLYSSAMTLVFTLGDGVHGFTLDESLGEFVLTHPNMKIPTRGKIYSINEANRWDWESPMQEYITDIQQGQGESQTRYTSRYVGSMVPDVHRTLQYGGIFGYPADARNPQGKLRLLYEAAPMAFLMEQAGGVATTGRESIMGIQPNNVHQRVPCVLGSRDDVQELCRYYEKADKKRAR